MSVPPAPPTKPHRARLALTRRAWLGVAAAFATGALLFVLLWLGQRDQGGDGTAGAPGTRPGRDFAPLPAPAGGTADTGNGRVRPGAPPAMPHAGASDGASPDVAPPPLQPAPPPLATTASPQSAPVPLDMPAPRYPAAAQRAGTSGEVLLQVCVDARGRPGEVSVLRGSGSRDLDRAAIAAARRWTFRPASRGGQAVDGVVNVPIRFDSQR